jgi:integrase
MKPTTPWAALLSAEMLGGEEAPTPPVRHRPIRLALCAKPADPPPAPAPLPALGHRYGGTPLHPPAESPAPAPSPPARRGYSNAPAIEPDPIPVAAPAPAPAAPPVPVVVAPAGGPPTVDAVMETYLLWAQTYYMKDGKPTGEARMIETSCRPMRNLYGATPARDFGPLALKAVRKAMVAAGYSRNEINKRVGRIVRVFKWAASEELVPPSVFQGLKSVSPLLAGRTPARETAPIGPVADAAVDAIKPHVARQVWPMVELQRLTGMRPGEVCQMRTGDIDRSGAVWAYVPGSHKTEHHGKKRTVFIGPRAQDVLRPWLRADPDAYLFSPAERMAEFRVDQHRRRKTKVQPSQIDRTKPNPKRTPGRRYTTGSYGVAVARACEKAGIPHWHPNQLRHLAATRIRAACGLDAARTILGHSSSAVTEVNAEVDLTKAADVMGRVG